MGQRVQMVRGKTWYGTEFRWCEGQHGMGQRVQMVRGATWYETESSDGERDNIV